MRLLRKQDVLLKIGKCKSSLYNDIAIGLFPPPIKINNTSSAWPDFEVDSIIAAIIRGESLESIKELVSTLVEERQSFQSLSDSREKVI